MAIFRKIHTQFWTDPFMQELTPEQRYFYLYLLTNDRTKQCGVYEITRRQICYDTGYNIDTVSKLLEYFINTGKIRYNSSTNEIAIKNWGKYNGSTSPKVQICINQELELVKDKKLIEYINNIDTSSQEEQEEEEEKEQDCGGELNINILDEKSVVGKMVKLWVEHNPGYFRDDKMDAPACLSLAQKIGKYKSWGKNEYLTTKKELLFESWKKIIDFVVTDPFLQKLPLNNLNNQFQNIVKKMTLPKTDDKPKTEKVKIVLS